MKPPAGESFETVQIGSRNQRSDDVAQALYLVRLEAPGVVALDKSPKALVPELCELHEQICTATPYECQLCGRAVCGRRGVSPRGLRGNVRGGVTLTTVPYPKWCMTRSPVRASLTSWGDGLSRCPTQGGWPGCRPRAAWPSPFTGAADLAGALFAREWPAWPDQPPSTQAHAFCWAAQNRHT
jgi:hypothetical protein